MSPFSILRKGGALEREKTIFVFSSMLHVTKVVLTFSNIV